MKVDLYLERDGTLVLITWARETNLGVYMGVRLSPEVENASYFRDGQRQLLRFPMMPDGKRKREEVPLARQSPIPAIRQSELILGRSVDVIDCAQSNPPAPVGSAGTTEIKITEDYLEGCSHLRYEAYIVWDGYAKEFLAGWESSSLIEPNHHKRLIRLFPLNSFSEHNLALIIWPTRYYVGDK